MTWRPRSSFLCWLSAGVAPGSCPTFLHSSASQSSGGRLGSSHAWALTCLCQCLLPPSSATPSLSGLPARERSLLLRTHVIGFQICPPSRLNPIYTIPFLSKENISIATELGLGHLGEGAIIPSTHLQEMLPAGCPNQTSKHHPVSPGYFGSHVQPTRKSCGSEILPKVTDGPFLTISLWLAWIRHHCLYAGCSS